MSLKKTYDAVKRAAKARLEENTIPGNLPATRGEGLSADQKNAMFKAGCDAMHKLDNDKLTAIMQTLHPELVVDGDLNKKKESMAMAMESALDSDDLDALAEVYAALAEATGDEDLADLALALISEENDEEEDEDDDKKKKNVEVHVDVDSHKEDDEDDEEDEDDKKDKLKESLNSIFGSEMLSEEAQVQVTTLFEAAVADKAIQLADKVAQRLEEEKAAEMEFILEQLDVYLEDAVTQYMEENSLAIEQGLRVEMMESFMHGFKQLAESHNLNVTVDDSNLVDSLGETVESLQEKLDKTLHENAQLKQERQDLIKSALVEEIGESLTLVEREKLAKLAEEIEFKDADTFASKLELIAEHYFGVEYNQELISEEDVVDPSELLKEEKTTTKNVPSDIAAAAAAISRTLKR